MRLDQYPDRLAFNDSGLPIPSNGVRRISLIKILTRFNSFLSVS